MLTTVQDIDILLSTSLGWVGPDNGGVANYLMVAGVVVMIFILLMNIVKRRRRDMAQANQPQLSARDRLEQMHQATGMRNELRQMMVELEELTRHFSAQLDAKSVRLEQLLEEAELKIEQLERASQQTPPPQATATQRPADPEHDPLTRQILALAEEGLDPMAIAEKTDEHIGKIELILSLHQHQSS